MTLRALRNKLALLKRALQKAQARRVELRRRMLARCQKKLAAVREQLNQRRVHERGALRDQEAKLRTKARIRCEARVANINRLAHGAKERVRDQARTLRERDTLIASAERRVREKERRFRKTASERRGESDDEVRQNLPDDLLVVFEKVKRQLAGSQRKSRTEAFLEWVEANPDEVLAITHATADAELSRLLKEHAEAERALHRERVTALRKAGYSLKEAKELAEYEAGLAQRKTGTHGVPF